MGDRTYVRLYIHPEDLGHPACQKFLGQVDPSDDESLPAHERYWEEANYAFYSDLEELAGARVRFHGHHGRGDEYDAQTFFSDGTGVCEYAPDCAWDENCVNVHLRLSAGEIHVDYDDLLKQIGRFVRWCSIKGAIYSATPADAGGTIPMSVDPNDPTSSLGP